MVCSCRERKINGQLCSSTRKRRDGRGGLRFLFPTCRFRTGGTALRKIVRAHSLIFLRVSIILSQILKRERAHSDDPRAHSSWPRDEDPMARAWRRLKRPTGARAGRVWDNEEAVYAAERETHRSFPILRGSAPLVLRREIARPSAGTPITRSAVPSLSFSGEKSHGLRSAPHPVAAPAVPPHQKMEVGREYHFMSIGRRIRGGEVEAIASRHLLCCRCSDLWGSSSQVDAVLIFSLLFFFNERGSLYSVRDVV